MADVRPGARKAAELISNTEQAKAALSDFQRRLAHEQRVNTAFRAYQIRQITDVIADLRKAVTPQSWWRGTFIRLSGLDIEPHLQAIEKAANVQPKQEEQTP